jgi:large subunit ribosomal protein L4
MRQAAYRADLGNRVQNDRVAIFGATLDAPKTKSFLAALDQLGWSGYKLLFLTSAEDRNAALSARNLPRVTVQAVNQTSLVDVLKNEAILCTRAAWDEMSARVEGKGHDAESAADAGDAASAASAEVTE